MAAKPGADAKAAVGELLTELEITRKEYAKLSIQLTQLDAELQQARDLNKSNNTTIDGLEKQLVAKEEEHRATMREAEEKYITKDAALAHRTRHLELEVQRLQAENEHMSKVESDNRALRENMLDLQATIEKMQLVNEDLRQRTRDGGGGVSYEEMEKDFQKKMAAAEKKFRAEAYRALSEEAKIALQGNDHLQNVLKRQNDSIELVLQRCKTLEQSHALMQNQQDRSSVELEQQVREVNRLTKALEETRSKNAQLDDAMRQRRVERASLELLFVEYEATRKKLAKAEEKSRRAVREADRWKNRAVQLTQELNDEQREVAERRLAQLQAMSDTVESNAIREEYRAQMRDRVQAKHQQGSIAYQFATQGGLGTVTTASQDNPYTFVDGSNNAFGGGATNDIASAITVKPMDILSIWSRKYDDGYTPNANATASGRDAVTSAEAEQLLEAMRQGVSPLALTNGATSMMAGSINGNGGGVNTPQISQSPSAGAPVTMNQLKPGTPMDTNSPPGSAPQCTARPGYNPLPPPSSARNSYSTATNSKSGGPLPAVINGGGRSSTNSGGAFGGFSNSNNPIGGRDAMVADRNKALSVNSQSASMHASSTTARLPPAFQNQNHTMQQRSGAASTKSVGGGGRNGSALGSRAPLHLVGKDGEMVLVATNRSLTKNNPHPNPPQISPSTMAEIKQRQQQVGGAGGGGDISQKITP